MSKDLSNLTFNRVDVLQVLRTQGITLAVGFHPRNWNDVVNYYFTNGPRIGAQKAEELRTSICNAAVQLALDWGKDQSIAHGVAAALRAANIFDLTPSQEALDEMYKKIEKLPPYSRKAAQSFWDDAVLGKEIRDDDEGFELSPDIKVDFNPNAPTISSSTKTYAYAVEKLKHEDAHIRTAMLEILYTGAKIDGWGDEFDKMFKNVDNRGSGLSHGYLR